ncbi:IS21-like element helper ATPase IstB [Cyanobium sp. ULC084]
MTNSWVEPPSRPALESALPFLLKQLKLAQFRSQWQAAEQQATADGWSPASYLYVLAEQEHQQRHQARLRRLLHEAHLPVPKTLADYDWAALPDLDRHQIEQLAHDTGWVDRAENLLLFGPSGVGKTHLAAGICRNLIALDRPARFFSATTLVQELQRAKADYALARALTKLDRYALLVIDDNRFAEAKGYGYVRKDEAETSVLFELVMHRYERKSLLVTSNQPFSEWENVFSTSAMTVAAVDRLVDHSTIIQINGESYRRKRARRTGRPVAG